MLYIEQVRSKKARTSGNQPGHGVKLYLVASKSVTPATGSIRSDFELYQQ